MWTRQQINKHIEVSKKLLEIKENVFKLIKNENISEYEVQKFILNSLKQQELKTDKHPPIVAFNNDTAKSHYFNAKKSIKAKQETLVLFDLWAAIPNYPYADITWMAYKGKKIPNDIQNAFGLVIKTRDNCLDFIRNSLKKGIVPTGMEVYKVTEKNLKGKTDDDFYTGHSLGFASPHGNNAHLSSNNKNKLKMNQGYAIEPSILIKNKFRVRVETDFYISKNKRLVITAGLQNKIIKL